jgi:iron complex outermembrane receptor protein
LLIKKHITVLCFLGLSWSQEALISGFIINDNDQTPIHGANIYFKKLGIGTVSQVDGRFVLDDLPYGEISLTISMIGYKDKEKSIVLDKTSYDLGVIYMLRETIKIEEIIVDAHHELQPKSFSSNIYITGGQYHSNLKSSLALTLDEETGLSIRSMGQGTTQPVLRGYSGDRFLLTEDGITAGDLSNTSIDHTVSMDMASYNKVRVIRGPEALLYGSNTIGGVINVSRQIDSETRLKKTSLQGILGTESSNSSLFGNVVCYLPLNYKHQLRFSLLSRNTGDQISPIGPLANTALSNFEVTGSYSYFGKDYRSTFSYGQLAMNYGIPGSPDGHISGVDIDMNKNTQKFNVHKDISILGFQTLDIDQRYINYGHTELEKGSSYPSVILDQQIFSLQNTLKGPKLHIGSLFQYRNFQAGGFYWTPDTKELNIAVFGLVEREIYNFTLQLSSRAEYLSVIPDVQDRLSNIDTSQVLQRDYSIFSAGIGVFRSWKNWEFSFGIMLTGRAPGIEDLYSDGPHLGTYAYEIGQPTLNLEKTIGLEASLEHHTDKSEIRMTGYQNFSPNYHISSKMGECEEKFVDGEGHPCAGADFIEWGSGSSGWLYKYQMQGLRVSVYGLESELKYKLTNSINLYGSISLIRGENLSDNTPLAYMPPDKFLFSTELDLNPITATLTLKKVSSQERLGEFETRTDGYFLTDISGTYIINSSNIIHKIIFRIDNIFDQEYYNHLSRMKLIMPEKGRSIGIQYRLVF